MCTWAQAAAPVEWYETHGAGHVGTYELGGSLVVDVVLGFFGRVDKALRADAP